MQKILLVVLVSICVFTSCGVYSFSGGDPGAAQTFSVSVFPNQASLVNPNLSQVFTEGLKDRFLRETRLKLTTEDGDWLFSGYIADYNVSPAAISGGDQAQLNRLTITVFVKFENTVEKEKSFEQQFSSFSDFNASRNLAEVEAQLMEVIVRQLTQDIYNRAVINW